MAYEINDINELIPWGLNPEWVDNQLDNTWGVGTATGNHTVHHNSNYWTHHHHTNTHTDYTYTKHIGSVEYGNGQTFNKDMWDSYATGTKGYRGNQVLEYGAYGLRADVHGAIDLSQTAGSTIFHKAYGSVSSEGGNVPGSSSTTTVRNHGKLEALTETVTLTRTVANSSESTTTNGYSQGKSLSIGVKLTDSIEADDLVTKEGASFELDTSLTNSTEINTSTTTQTSNSKTLTNSHQSTITVQPGDEVTIFISWKSQKVNVPFTSPITASGHSTYWDNYNNKIPYGVGTAMDKAVIYGVPNANAVNIRDENEAYFLASGMILNENNYTFTIEKTAAKKIDRFVQYEIEGKLNYKLDVSYKEGDSDSALNIESYSERDTASIHTDGIQEDIGLEYRSSENTDSNGVLRGTEKTDWIELGGSNQVAYSFGGDDFVFGTHHADKVYAKGDKTGGDKIFTYGGDDYIEAIYGSDWIDAGDGDDEIIVRAEGNLVDDITLGKGADKLEITLESGLDKDAFIVRDASLEDSIEIKGGKDLNIKSIGDTVELYQGDDRVGIFESYGSEFDYAASGLLNIAVMNMKDLKGNIQGLSLDEWWDEIVLANITGDDIITNYGEFISNKDNFTENIGLSLDYVNHANIKISEKFKDAIIDAAYGMRNNYTDVSSLMTATLFDEVGLSNASLSQFFSDPLS